LSSDIDELFGEEVYRSNEKGDDKASFSGLFGKKKREDKSKKATIVGVFGAHSGVGVTRLCIDIARELKIKSNVAIVERNKDKSLKHYRERGIDIFDSSLADINIGDYDYILLDFGELYNLTKSEPILLQNSREELNDRRAEYGIEMQYCNEKILVCSTCPWRVLETEFYLADESGDGIDNWVKVFYGESKSSEFEKLMNSYFDSKMIFMENNNNALQNIVDIIEKQ